ncbi:hypothetical protein GCM10028804_58940 [Larkinella terrae]
MTPAVAPKPPQPSGAGIRQHAMETQLPEITAESLVSFSKSLQMNFALTRLTAEDLNKVQNSARKIQAALRRLGPKP